MTRIVAMVCALVLTVPVSGQTLIGSVNLGALGYGAATVQTVEADGNPATVELLAVRNADGLYSVGRPTCAGAWFNPRAGLPVSLFAGVTVSRLGAVDVLLVRDYGGSVLYAVGLTPC